MTGSDGATSGGTSSAARTASETAKRRPRRRAAGRVPIQMPPASDPIAKDASANPPWAREACASPNAGITTSTTPNPMPSARHEIITVRTAEEPSAPACDAVRGVPLAASTGGARANHAVPIPAQAAAVMIAAHAGATIATAATISGPEDEEQLLQPGLERVRRIAQAPSRQQARPERPHARPDGRQRRPGERGEERRKHERRRALRGRQRQRRRARPGRRWRAAAARAPGRPGRSAGPTAARRSRPRANWRRRRRPATAYERPSLAHEQHGRERRHPVPGAARAARRRDAPDPGRAQHVGVAAQTRGLLAHGTARCRSRPDPALGVWRQPPEAALVRAEQERRAARRERRGVDRRRLRPELQRGRDAPVSRRRPATSNVACWLLPMRTSASARPSLANANWSTTAPRTCPAGRTRFHERPASVER